MKLIALLLSITPLLAEVGCIVGNRVSARNGPGTGYARKWYLDNKQPLIILDKKDKWLKASNWEGNEFWVHRNYLRTDVSCGLVKVDKANVRKAPSLKSSLYGPLQQLFRHDTFKFSRGKVVGSKDSTMRNMSFGFTVS